MRIAELARRVRGMIRRFRFESTTDEGAQVITGRGLSEDFEAEHVEPYGLRSKPHPGAEGVSVQIGGTPDNTAAWVYDRRYGPKELETGDVCVYSSGDNRITVAADGSIELENSTGARITMDAAGNVEIDGTATIKLGGDTPLALNTDLVAYHTAAFGFWSDLAAWAAAATGVWADDLVELKLVTGPIATTLTTLIPQVAATAGSPKGRG